MPHLYEIDFLPAAAKKYRIDPKKSKNYHIYVKQLLDDTQMFVSKQNDIAEESDAGVTSDQSTKSAPKRPARPKLKAAVKEVMGLKKPVQPKSQVKHFVPVEGVDSSAFSPSESSRGPSPVVDLSKKPSLRTPSSRLSTVVQPEPAIQKKKMLMKPTGPVYISEDEAVEEFHASPSQQRRMSPDISDRIQSLNRSAKHHEQSDSDAAPPQPTPKPRNIAVPKTAKATFDLASAVYGSPKVAAKKKVHSNKGAGFSPPTSNPTSGGETDQEE